MRSSVSNCGEQVENTLKTSTIAAEFNPHRSVGHLLIIF